MDCGPGGQCREMFPGGGWNAQAVSALAMQIKGKIKRPYCTGFAGQHGAIECRVERHIDATSMATMCALDNETTISAI